MSDVFAGLLSSVNDISAYYVNLVLDRCLPHDLQCNIHLPSYDLTPLTASLNERIRGITSKRFF